MSPMPDRRPLPVLTLLALLAGCSASPPSTATQTTGKPEAPAPQVAVTSDRLAGRWVLSPGDCHMPPSEAPEQGSPVVSPAGAVLTLGSGGNMTSRQGDFIRRGTWKFDGSALKIAVEPPPRRLDMGFIPVLEPGRLVLQGADEMVLVYHRDPFVGVDHTP